MTRRRGYDPDRMVRALGLKCDPGEAPGQYRVTSGTKKGEYYDVDLTVDPPCYCDDSRFQSAAMCKHELLARLHDGDAPLITALGQTLVTKQQRLREAGLE